MLLDTLDKIARTPRLLVACDFDGTLSPIVENPEDARPLPSAMAAFTALAGLDETEVALISGRAIADLRTLADPPEGTHLIGSHGSEFDRGIELPPDAMQLHDELRAALERIVDARPGATLEVKPVSIAVHVRRATPDVAEQVLTAVRRGPAGWDGVHVTTGKAVIELLVLRTSKGDALDLLRQQLGATATLFIGDDVTDEDAFGRLRGEDVGIKVGDGETAAGERVADPVEVAKALDHLQARRAEWLATDR